MQKKVPRQTGTRSRYYWNFDSRINSLLVLVVCMQIRKDKNNIIFLSFIDKFYFIRYNFCGELFHLNIKCLLDIENDYLLFTFFDIILTFFSWYI